MMITGLDPGSPVGVSTLEWDGIAFHWRDSRTEPSAMLDEIIAHCAGIVAIEKPSGFYPSRGMLSKRGGALAKICEGLLMAGWVGGELKGLARAAGKKVYEVSAPDARRSLGVLIGGRGKAREKTVDQQIAGLVPQLVRGWPKRSCVATRDAAVAAMFVLQFVRGGVAP